MPILDSIILLTTLQRSCHGRVAGALILVPYGHLLTSQCFLGIIRFLSSFSAKYNTCYSCHSFDSQAIRMGMVAYPEELLCKIFSSLTSPTALLSLSLSCLWPIFETQTTLQLAACVWRISSHVTYMCHSQSLWLSGSVVFTALWFTNLAVSCLLLVLVVLRNLDLLKLSLCKITEMEGLWCSSESLAISLGEVICVRD